jgi:ABC-type multidrug transport system ATPase subunit
MSSVAAPRPYLQKTEISDSDPALRASMTSGDSGSLTNSMRKFSPSWHPKLRREQRSEISKDQWRRFLSSPGITLSFSNVSVVQGRCWNSRREHQLVLQSCVGLFEPAKLHAIVDVDQSTVAGLALMDVLCGSTPPAEGTVTGNNIPVSSTTFRKAVGMVATLPETVIFGNLTVGENIAFALEMRCRCPSVPSPTDEELFFLEDERQRFGMESSDSPCCGGCCAGEGGCCCNAKCVSHWLPFLKFGHENQWSRTLAASSFFDLETSTKARDLSPFRKLLLTLAMELVLDPPIVFLSVPSLFASLDPHNVSVLMFYLKRMCVDLGKTVVCLMNSLPFTVFDAIDSVVLLGMEGQTLYSGDKSEMLSYVSMLGLPADLLASPMYDSFAPHFGEGGRATVSMLSSNKSINSFHSVASAGVVSPVHRSGDAGEGRGRARCSTAPAATTASMSAPFERHTTDAFYESPLRRGTTMITDDEGNLVVNTGQAVVDLAVLWAENPTTTAKFAALFYDSAARRALTTRQEDLATNAVGSLAFTSPQSISFLKFRSQSSYRQIMSLLHVFFLQAIRASDLYLLWLLLSTVLGFTSWLVTYQNNDEMGMMNIRGIMFILFFVTLQINVGHADMYTSELQLYRYQRDSGFYSMPVYVVVLLLRISATRFLFLATIAPFVVYLMQTSRSLITLIGLLSVAHSLVVFAKAALIGNARAVQVLSLMYVGYCAIFSGFLINLTSLPTIFGYASLLRAGYAAAVAEELRGKPIACDGGNSSAWTNHSSYCYYGDEYLRVEGFEYDDVSRSTHVFVGVTMVCLVVIAARLWCM